MRYINFLCTANHYRSRVAEIVFNQHVRKPDDWCAVSRAIRHASAARHPGMFPLACRELRAFGFNVTKLHEYRNPIVFHPKLDPHDLVIVMCEREHAPMLNTYDRAWDVEDVPMWDVRRGVERIIKLTEDLIDELRVA